MKTDEMWTQLENYMKYLKDQERGRLTMQQYRRDIEAFLRKKGTGEITKEAMISYKEYLTESYRPSSVNVKLAAINGFLKFLGKSDLCVSQYIKKEKIKEGAIFITRNGKPLDRSNIWKMMKKLCKKAGVDEKNVFPQTLRHLFARCFYERDKDIAKLADVLGHSSINTTRIYIATPGWEHRKMLDALGLVV